MQPFSKLPVSTSSLSSSSSHASPEEQGWEIIDGPNLAPYEKFVADNNNNKEFIVTGSKIANSSPDLELQGAKASGNFLGYSVQMFFVNHRQIVNDFKAALAGEYGKNIVDFAFPCPSRREEEALRLGLSYTIIHDTLQEASTEAARKPAQNLTNPKQEGADFLATTQNTTSQYSPGTKEWVVADPFVTLAENTVDQVQALAQAATALTENDSALPLLTQATNATRFTIACCNLALQLGLTTRGSMGASALGTAGGVVGYFFKNNIAGNLVGSVVGGSLGGDSLQQSLARGIGGSAGAVFLGPALGTMIAGPVIGPLIGPSIGSSIGGALGPRLVDLVVAARCGSYVHQVTVPTPEHQKLPM